MSGLDSIVEPKGKHIIIVASLTEATGNLTTAKRIAGHLGASDRLRSCHETDPDWLAAPSLILVAIHALRCAHLVLSARLSPSSRVVLILGGTDINERTEDADSLRVMTQVVTRADRVVAFSPILASRFLHYWPHLSTKISTIFPAVEVFPSPSPPPPPSSSSSSSELDSIPSLRNTIPGILPSDMALILPAGLRPVKDPLFLLDTLVRWNLALPPGAPRMFLMIIGPKLDVGFSQSVAERLEGSQFVVYHPSVPPQALHRALREFDAVVNSSLSEGLSNVLLEAMLLGVPVVARRIPGNESIVEHGVTGLLFDQPEQVPALVEQLAKDAAMREKIIQSAAAFAHQHHDIDVERQRYQTLLKELDDFKL